MDIHDTIEDAMSLAQDIDEAMAQASLVLSKCRNVRENQGLAPNLALAIQLRKIEREREHK